MSDEYNYDDKVYELHPDDFQDLDVEENESNLLGCVGSISTEIEKYFVG